MKPKKKMKKLRITEADYLLAQRKAARLEEIAAHGKPVSMRSTIHKSKKIYDYVTGEDSAAVPSGKNVHFHGRNSLRSQR